MDNTPKNIERLTSSELVQKKDEVKVSQLLHDEHIINKFSSSEVDKSLSTAQLFHKRTVHSHKPKKSTVSSSPLNKTHSRLSDISWSRQRMAMAMHLRNKSLDMSGEKGNRDDAQQDVARKTTYGASRATSSAARYVLAKKRLSEKQNHTYTYTKSAGKLSYSEQSQKPWPTSSVGYSDPTTSINSLFTRSWVSKRTKNHTSSNAVVSVFQPQENTTKQVTKDFLDLGKTKTATSSQFIPLPILLTIFFFIILIMLAVIIGSVAGNQTSTGSLTGNEMVIAQALMANGYDHIHTAAALANLKAESNVDPENMESPDALVNPSRGIGIAQWTTPTEKQGLLAKAASMGKSWKDIEVQAAYLIETCCRDGYPWGDTPGATYVTSADPAGKRVRVATYQEFLAETSLEGATLAWCYGYERPGIPHEQTRLEYAQEYLNKLDASDSGGGQDYNSASASQKSVVDACNSTPWPGPGLCATWTSNVFRNAGVGSWGGNAEDQFAAYCHSSDRSQLKVGMIIACDDSPTSHWGHVGIYVGDGHVMESLTDGIHTTDLDKWIAYNSRGGAEPVRWGWMGGVALN